MYARNDTTRKRFRGVARTIVVLFAAGVVIGGAYLAIPGAVSPQERPEGLLAAQRQYPEPSLARGLPALIKEIGKLGAVTLIGRKILCLRL